MILFKKLIANDVGCQNTRKDAWIALWTLVTPFLQQKKAKMLVQEWFKDYTGSKQVFFLSSARNAFYTLLRGLFLAEGDEVLIQPFSCVVIPQVIKELKLTPVLCDITKKNYSMDLEKAEKLITARTKVLVLQHTFGIPADIEKARILCKKYNLILIEDCAHAIGATYTFMGKTFNVGSIGDAAFFSFGRDKAVSTSTGGALVFNNPDIANWVENITSYVNSLPTMSKALTFQSLYYIIITKFLVRPLYYFLHSGKFFLFASQKLKLVESVTSIQFFDPRVVPVSRYSVQLYPVLWNQLNHLKKTTDHRKQLFRRYALTLGFDVTEGLNYMRFPLIIEELGIEKADVNTVYNELKYNLRYKQNVLVGTWYSSPFFPASANENTDFTFENFPVLNTLLPDKVLNLPTCISMDRTDAESIISCVVATLEPYQYNKELVKI
jgi:perosamine synthetase